MRFISFALKILQPFFAIALALFIGLSLTLTASENPWDIFLILLQSSFLSPYDFGMTLSYSTPLILTGLSVAVAYKAGLFNIGAEGQLIMGGLAAVLIGIFCPPLSFVSPFLALLGAALMGGAWAGLAGFFKASRGAHEVITTIMLNFIAAGLASYFTVYLLKDPHSQNPQTLAVEPDYLFKTFEFFQGAPVSTALFVTLVVVIVTWLFLYRTRWGFEMRATGENDKASAMVGIDVARIQIFSMFFAGALAGLVGAIEVLGRMGCYKLDFSPGYGFTGIAVAFLAKGNPLAIVFSAFLLGALCKGSSDLEIYSQSITSDLSLILQSLLILSVASENIWSKLRHKIIKRGA